MRMDPLDAIADGMDAETPFWVYLFPPAVRNLVALGARFWRQAIEAAIKGGVKDPAKLADLAFFMHHPWRLGRAISSTEADAAALVKQWKGFHAAARKMLRGAGGKSGPLSIVNTPLPRTSDGLHPTKAQSKQYGLPETIAALTSIGATWHKSHPTGPKIQISDISRRGGGKLAPHGSHRMGIDVDIRFMRTDGKMRAVNPLIKSQKRFFDKALTQELVDVIRANTVLNAHLIMVNKRIDLSNVDGDNDHNNHMHVRFCMPGKYDLAASRKASKTPAGSTYISCT